MSAIYISVVCACIYNSVLCRILTNVYCRNSGIVELQACLETCIVKP